MRTNRGTSGEQGQPNQREFCGMMERAMGIEPTSEAWEASILPLNYARRASSEMRIALSPIEGNSANPL
jgi:hypothetical protein